MHVFIFSSSVVPNDFAHPIQILNTACALARQPGVAVTLYFLTLLESPEVVWKRYGIAPPTNVTLCGLVPAWYFRAAKMEPFLQPKKYAAFRLVKQLLRWKLRSQQAKGPVCVYTRNENVLTFLGPMCKKLGIPVFMELHWFKYVDYFRKWIARSERKGEPKPALSAAREYLAQRRKEERKRLKKASGILCLTQPMRRVLESWQIAAPMLILPSGVHLPSGDPPSQAGASIELLYSGQLYPWKGVDTLIAALPHLPAIHLTIVGGNQKKDIDRILKIARELKVQDRIFFTGHLPHPQVRSFVSRAQVCVLPSPRRGYPEARHFTSPMKLFEFAAEGKAIVASDVPSLRDVLRHGDNAWLVKPDNPRALADGIRHVLSDKGLRERLGENALRLAKEHSFERRAERIVDFLGRSS